MWGGELPYMPAWALVLEAAEAWGLPPWEIVEKCNEVWWKRWLAWREAKAAAQGNGEEPD